MAKGSKYSLITQGFFSVLLIFLGAGCQNIYTEAYLTQPSSGLVLDRKIPAYVAVPADGVDDHGTYQGSGIKVAGAIQNAFAQKLQTVFGGAGHESLDTALVSARNRGAGYLFYPTILQWENNPTEWTYERDHLQIKIELLDVSSGGTIHSTIFSGKSKLMTFGDVPEDMLPEPLAKYANFFSYRDN